MPHARFLARNTQQKFEAISKSTHQYLELKQRGGDLVEVAAEQLPACIVKETHPAKEKWDTVVLVLIIYSAVRALASECTLE